MYCIFCIHLPNDTNVPSVLVVQNATSSLLNVYHNFRMNGVNQDSSTSLWVALLCAYYYLHYASYAPGPRDKKCVLRSETTTPVRPPVESPVTFYPSWDDAILLQLKPESASSWSHLFVASDGLFHWYFAIIVCAPNQPKHFASGILLVMLHVAHNTITSFDVENVHPQQSAPGCEVAYLLLSPTLHRTDVYIFVEHSKVSKDLHKGSICKLPYRAILWYIPDHALYAHHCDNEKLDMFLVWGLENVIDVWLVIYQVMLYRVLF